MSSNLSSLFPHHDLPDIEIQHIITDSRRMLPGGLFIALQGDRHDGNDYIEAAVRSGAAAVLTNKPQPDLGVPVIVVSDTAPLVAELSAKVYRTREADMSIVGVTGTDGKTTITHIIRHIWHKLTPPVGSIGTMGTIYPGHDAFAHTLTTPMAPDLHRELATMREHGVQKLVMEVSSHALDQNRVGGVPYEVGIFTNLTHDHLDYHVTMENYQAAKLKLFERLPEHGLAIAKADYPTAAKIAEVSPAHVIGYKVQGEPTVEGFDRDVAVAEIVSFSKDGTKFNLHLPKLRRKSGDELPEQMIPAFVPFVGSYNIANATAALITLLWYGLPLQDILQELKDVPPVDGRFKRVECGQPFQVIVDFAHTPVGTASLLKQVRLETPGKIFMLVSGAGMRDRVKRRIITEVSIELADVVILTLEEISYEDPNQILRDLKNAVPEALRDQIPVIPLRTEAIQYAIEHAQAGDSIVLPGMGNYEEIPVADVIVPWSDAKVAEVFIIQRLLREALENFPRDGSVKIYSDV